MESEARYTLIGTVILVLSGLLIAAVLWLSDRHYNGAENYYTIYFRDQSLAGLQTNSNVTMKGIKVGSVVRYSFSPKNVEEINVTIQLDPQTPVREDTRAVIQRNILTGLARINLIGTTSDSGPLTEPPPGEKYPVIGEGRSTFEEIQNTLPEITRKADEMLARINAILSDPNRNALADTLRNVADLTARLKTEGAAVNQALESLSKAADQLKVLGERLTLTTDNIDVNVARVSTELVSTLRQVRISTQQIGESGNKIALAVKDAADVGIVELQSVARELRSTAEKFSLTVERYSSPRELLFGPNRQELGPGEELR